MTSVIFLTNVYIVKEILISNDDTVFLPQKGNTQSLK